MTAPAARVLPAFCLRALRARGYMEGGLWLLRLVVSALAAALLRRQRLRCSSCSRAASRVTAHCGSFMWCCCSSRPGASRSVVSLASRVGLASSVDVSLFCFVLFAWMLIQCSCSRTATTTAVRAFVRVPEGCADLRVRVTAARVPTEHMKSPLLPRRAVRHPHSSLLSPLI